MRALILCLGLLLLNTAQAQNGDVAEYAGTLAPAESLVFELDGLVTLRPAAGGDWRVRAQSEVKKRVLLGKTNADDRPPYALEIVREGDRIVVRPRPRPDLEGVGLLFVKETLSHEVEAPEAATVVLRADEAEVDAEASFRRLLIDQHEGTVRLRVNRAVAGRIDVRSREGSVTVEGEDVGSAFTMSGEGGNAVEVRTWEGDVHVDLL